MASDVDLEALGLLDGLEGHARQERIDLITWLLDRGFGVDHIQGSLGAPLNLPASRVIGDDGTFVSAREICRSTGIDLEFLQRIHGAVGLPASRIPTLRICRASTAKLLPRHGSSSTWASIPRTRSPSCV